MQYLKTSRISPQFRCITHLFAYSQGSPANPLRRFVANSRITDPNVFKIKVDMVKEFAEREGRLPMIGFSDWQTRLALFVRSQRSQMRNRNLEEYQIKLMESIPKFSWGSTKLGSFQDNVKKLKEFVDKNGDFPKKNGKRENGEEKIIFSFLSNKRTQYKAGKLSSSQIEQLEVITGFKWAEYEMYPFEYYVDKTIKFHEKYGELPKRRGIRVVEDCDEEEWRLATFLHSQRGSKKMGKLTIEKIEQLENIPGFEWRMFEQRPFDENVERVVRFCQRYGCLPLRDGIRDEGSEASLAMFLATQRLRQRSGLLTESQVKVLESIPYFFWTKPTR